jgi:Zn-dependent protease
MRGVSKAVARGVLAGSFVLLLAVPAEARPRDGGDRWFERKLDPIVKVIKKFVIRSMGDGLSDPRP